MSTVETIDNAITSTISRTIITHGSTQIMVLSMLLFGGATLHYFALALTIGILFGIYSSVFVAAAIAMWLGIKRKTWVSVFQARAIPTTSTPAPPSEEKASPMSSRSHPPPRRWRARRERFVAHMEGALPPLTAAVRDVLLNQMSAAKSGRDIQQRRDALVDQGAGRGKWVDAVGRGWRRAMIPPPTAGKAPGARQPGADRRRRGGKQDPGLPAGDGGAGKVVWTSTT